MKCVLITGAAGFLGSRFWKWLQEHDPAIKIVGIDDLSGGSIENIPCDGEFHQIDCGEAAAVFSAQHFDYVFHFAAYAAECLSPFARKFTYTNNIVATAAIVNECIRSGVQRLVFTSSAAVYGGCQAPCQERDAPQPSDP